MAAVRSDSDMTTTTWMKFFRDAGIPPQVAGNYAVLFADHRIQTDMLQDLSRDILQAMGITVMGDIIAILKNAKQKYEQVTREKALGNESVFSAFEFRKPVQAAASGPILVSGRPQEASPPVGITPIRTSTPVTRMLDRLTQQPAVSPRISTSKANNPKPMTSRLAMPSRQSSSGASLAQARTTIINLKRKEERAEEVPVKKVRRVLPEHEGRYRIKMPVGATPKTRRLLQQQTTSPTKSSVFSRLGDPKVSSTTGNGSEGTKITVTDFGRSVTRPTVVALKKSSIFDRLGPGKSQVSSTSADDEEALQLHPNEVLQYHGVLKGDPRQPPTATIGPLKVANTKVTFVNTVNTAKKSNILARLGPQSRMLSSAGISKTAAPAVRLKLAAPSKRLVVGQAPKPASGLKSDRILATRQVPLKNRLGPKTIALRQAGSVKMIRTISTKKKVNTTATLTTGRKLRLAGMPVSTGIGGGIFNRLGKLQA